MEKNAKKIMREAMHTEVVTGTGAVRLSGENDITYAKEIPKVHSKEISIDYEYKDKNNYNKVKTETFIINKNERKIRLPAIPKEYDRVYEASIIDYEFGKIEVTAFGQAKKSPFLLSGKGKEINKKYEDMVKEADKEYELAKKARENNRIQAYLEAEKKSTLKVEELKSKINEEYIIDIDKAKSRRKNRYKKSKLQFNKIIKGIEDTKKSKLKLAEEIGVELRQELEEIANGKYNMSVKDLEEEKKRKYQEGEKIKERNKIEKRFLGWGVISKDLVTEQLKYIIEKPEKEIEISTREIVNIKALYEQEDIEIIRPNKFEQKTSGSKEKEFEGIKYKGFEGKLNKTCEALIKFKGQVEEKEISVDEIKVYDNDIVISPSIYGGFFLDYGHTLRINKSSLEDTLRKRNKCLLNVSSEEVTIDDIDKFYEVKNINKNLIITINYKKIDYLEIDLDNEDIVNGEAKFIKGSKYKFLSIGPGDNEEDASSLVNNDVSLENKLYVAFVDGNRRFLAPPQVVCHGESAIEPTVDEVLSIIGEKLNRNNMFFKEWDSDFSKVTSQMEIVALYSEKASIRLREDDETEIVIKDEDGLELTSLNKEIIRNKYYNKKYILSKEGNLIDISNIENANANIVIGVGGRINCPIPSEKYKLGLTFKYWKDSKGIKYKPKEKISVNEKELNLKAIYGTTMRITFKGLDGLYLGSEKVGKGADGNVLIPPKVQGLIFKGWNQDLSNVRTDMIVSAIYEAKISILDKEECFYVRYNCDINDPIYIKEKKGFDFEGWYDKEGNRANKITKDITLTPKYIPRTNLTPPYNNRELYKEEEKEEKEEKESKVMKFIHHVVHKIKSILKWKR